MEDYSHVGVEELVELNDDTTLSKHYVADEDESSESEGIC